MQQILSTTAGLQHNAFRVLVSSITYSHCWNTILKTNGCSSYQEKKEMTLTITARMFLSDCKYVWVCACIGFSSAKLAYVNVIGITRFLVANEFGCRHNAMNITCSAFFFNSQLDSSKHSTWMQIMFINHNQFIAFMRNAHTMEPYRRANWLFEWGDICFQT